MLQRRGTTTDRLANVIQVIQLGRKTGILSIERGEGGTQEEGTITFIQGQITQAYAGQRRDQAALVWLNGWGMCRFTFVAGEMEPTTAPLPSLPHTGSLQTPYDTSARMRAATERVRTENGLSGVSPPAPYRTRQVDEALYILDQAGLSRMHRRLLLLINGQRTFLELERLLGRTQYEVQQLLRDLVFLGLIGLS